MRPFDKNKALPLAIVITSIVLGACQPNTSAVELVVSDPMLHAIPNLPTDRDLKVAFIGDSGYGANFEAVLTLIKNEGAALVLHQGDFDYAHDARGFFAKIDAILGPNMPYLASVGNHDIGSWNADCADAHGCYAQFLQERMARLGMTTDDPNLDDQMYAVTYRGLKLVFVGQERWASDTQYPRYIQHQLADDTHIWRICGWHKNQAALQLGGKSNEMGWGVYEICKQQGAIISNGHEHNYSRTKTLTHMQNLTVDTQQHPLVGGVPGNPDQLRVGPGRSFVVVSGIAGRSMRPQERCRPYTYPYGGESGCNYIWAKAYTTDQTGGVEKAGALFIVFNYQGDPTKAHGYFKTSDGEMVDEFDIVATFAKGETS
jgi:hypothetical protein